MSNTIFLAGGAGCLGTNILEHFLPKNFRFVVLDNLSTGKKESLPVHDKLYFYEGSISDYSLVESLFEKYKPSIVINSAAAYKDPDDWSEDTLSNVIGSINLAKAALKFGVKSLINFQTALCFGRPSKIPIPNHAPTNPFTSYGISKTAGELYLLNSGLNVISLRLANICGPRLSIGPIPTFYSRLKEGKSCFCSDSVRDFIDISDFLSLMEILLENNNYPTGVYNVSTGKGSSIKELFDVVCEYLNMIPPEVKIVPVQEDDVKEVVLDATFTEETFSWKAKISFKETIYNQLKWYDKYGINHIYSHLKQS